MIDVTCAIIIDENGLVLATQRSAQMKMPLKWEFPGGKVETGESLEECLKREIQEELGILLQLGLQLPEHVHHYPDISIRLIPFICKIEAGSIDLKEHLKYSWLSAEDLPGLDWAEADVPVLNHYLKHHTKNDPK